MRTEPHKRHPSEKAWEHLGLMLLKPRDTENGLKKIKILPLFLIFWAFLIRWFQKHHRLAGCFSEGVSRLLSIYSRVLHSECFHSRFISFLIFFIFFLNYNSCCCKELSVSGSEPDVQNRQMCFSVLVKGLGAFWPICTFSIFFSW